MSQDILAGLTSFWLGSQSYNLATFEAYYHGQQAAVDSMLTTEQAAKADITRFWAPVNYAATVIDEPIGYLTAGRITVQHDDERVQAWGERYLQRRLRPRLDDLIRWQGLYGEAFLHFWTDYTGARRGLKVEAIAPIEGGKRRVLADYGGEDPEELTAAVLHKFVPVDSSGTLVEYRITLTIDRIVVEKRKVQTRGAGGDWELVSDQSNPAGVLPVVPLFNPIPSDILDFIPIQDDLDKLHLDLRLGREYHGLPLLWTDAHDAGKLEVGAGRVFSGGKFGRIDPPSPQPLLDERDALLSAGAKIARSLALAEQAGGNPSEATMRYRQQNFESRLQAKAQRGEQALEIALATAARLVASDKRLYDLETRRIREEERPPRETLLDVEYAVTWTPHIPADEKASAEIASIMLNQLGSSQETALGKAGVEEPAKEIERAQKERENELRMPPVEPGDAGDA